MTAQPLDSPPETPHPGQTSRSEAQRTYDRLSRFYDLTEGLPGDSARRSLEAAGLEVFEARRSSILGLPVAIVMGHKPAATSA